MLTVLDGPYKRHKKGCCGGGGIVTYVGDWAFFVCGVAELPVLRLRLGLNSIPCADIGFINLGPCEIVCCLLGLFGPISIVGCLCGHGSDLY